MTKLPPRQPGFFLFKGARRIKDSIYEHIPLVKMSKMGYNTRVNHIKSGRMLSASHRIFSSRVRGTNTMSDITLPLFSVQSGTKEIPLTQGKYAIVDASDYEWLSRFHWRILVTGRSCYAIRHIRKDDGTWTTLRMHRAIFDAPDGALIDHVDGNGLNNTRGNLRLATKSENAKNTKIRSNNLSGYRGVSWFKRDGTWRATIQSGRKWLHIGYYGTPEEAARAYDAVAMQLHGQFARPNFAEAK